MYRVQVWRRGKTVLTSLQDTPDMVANYLSAYAQGIGELTDYAETEIRSALAWASGTVGFGHGRIGSSTFTIERVGIPATEVATEHIF